jgi:hypothetical protein
VIQLSAAAIPIPHTLEPLPRKLLMDRYELKGLLGFALLLVLIAGGAAADEREERINAAIPLSIAGQSALEELRRVSTDRAQFAAIEQQFHTKMRLRALQCSQDYSIPGNLSNEEIRRAHGGEACYAHADADIAEWLGLHSVGFILSLPSLRPLSTASPAFIVAGSAAIQRVKLASKASVGVLETYKDTQVVDLTTGAPIFTAAFKSDEVILSVSPNGRLYTTTSRGEVRFYDAQNGMLIAAPHWCMVMPGCGFHWLDNRSVMIYSNQNNGSEIVDLRSGVHAPFGANFERIAHLTAVGGARNEFISFANTGLLHFRLNYVDDQPRVDVLQVDQIKLNLNYDDNGGLDGSGRRYFNNSDGKLYITSTDAFKTDVIEFGSFFVQRVIPTTDPDKVIVAGYVMGGSSTWTFYLYSLRGQTLAAIDTGSLLGTQFLYHAARNTLWVMKDTKLALVGTLNVQEAIDRQSFISNVGAVSHGLQTHGTVVLSPGATGIVTSRGAVRGIEGPVPTEAVAGPISDLAKDAELQGIGVYAAENPNAADTGPGRYVGTLAGTNVSIYQRPDKTAESQGNPPYVGTIKVRVQANVNPLVLVLSSYSKVSWQISLDPGARLKAILLSGPHGSSVSGQGNVRVVAIGNAYSYVLGSPEYTLLQNEVYTWTGKRIGLFQCGYQASDFVVAAL